MQVIKDNYHELKRLKDEYELVEWIYEMTPFDPAKIRRLVSYKEDLLKKLYQVMDGVDDIA